MLPCHCVRRARRRPTGGLGRCNVFGCNHAWMGLDHSMNGSRIDRHSRGHGHAAPDRALPAGHGPRTRPEPISMCQSPPSLSRVTVQPRLAGCPAPRASRFAHHTPLSCCHAGPLNHRPTHPGYLCMADLPTRNRRPRDVLTSPMLYGEAISLLVYTLPFLEEDLDRNAEHPVLGELHDGFLGQMARSDGFKVNSILILTSTQGTGIFVLVDLALQHHCHLDGASPKSLAAPVASVAMANGAGSGGCNNKRSGAQLLQSMGESFPFISVYPVYPRHFVVYTRLP